MPAEPNVAATMSYSPDMLEAALNVLRVDKAESNPRGLSTRNLERFIRYELRARGPNNCPTTWVDQDLSEDFQPDAEKTRERTRRRVTKRKVPPEADKTDSDHPRRLGETPKGSSSIQDRVSAGSGIVILKFNTPSAKLLLAGIPMLEGGQRHASIDNGSIANAFHKQPPADMSTLKQPVFDEKYFLRSTRKVGDLTR